MYLINSTADFKLYGVPKLGFPIVLNEDMTSCTVANQFLRYYLMRGQIGSRKSWEATGRAIYDYFSFLEANGLFWGAVNSGEAKGIVNAYRDYSFEVADLKTSTVRQRVLYVCEFYDWAKKEGLVAHLPYEWEERRVLKGGGFLQHVDASGGKMNVRSVMPKVRKNLVKYLTRDQSKTLLRARMNSHHLMIIRLALGSGLRREELATFPVAYVFDPDRAGVVGRNVSISLDPEDGTGMKAKGDKARTIWITRKLMRDLYHYLVHVRGERACRSTNDHKPLFLNDDGKPFALDGKGIERQVRTVGRRVGLEVHPHMLRHTYATQTLVALQRTSEINPLVFLQNQLGHASITTTMVYLHAVDTIADDAVLAYGEELDDMTTTATAEVS